MLRKNASVSGFMWLVYLLLALALLYAGFVSVISFTQTRLLFPTQIAAAGPPSLPRSAESLAVRTPDGEHLSGVRLAPKAGEIDGSPILLGFGGNAWNAEVMALYLHDLFPESEVVTFHYRGYAPSSGQPSAAALLKDSLAIFDHLRQDNARPVIPVGFSIGSGVAAYLARHRPVDGLILVTPFDTLEALAREHFPWAPVGLLLRHHLPTIDFVRDSAVPTALITAGRDTIVPARRSEPLRKVMARLVFDRIIADAGHNDLYEHPAFIVEMREALSRIMAEAGSRTLPRP